MRTLIMSPERVERTLARLAHEVIERNQGGEGLVIFGIEHSGVMVAQALSRHISTIEPGSFPVFSLNAKAFREDWVGPTRPDALSGQEVNVTGKHVLLVDDVLFSGRTARAALDTIVRYGRPSSIQLAILIDRGGHREVPIQATYIGRRIPTKHKERVVVAAQAEITVYIEE